MVANPTAPRRLATVPTVGAGRAGASDLPFAGYVAMSAIVGRVVRRWIGRMEPS
jgi:hypothetical protein